MAGTSAAQVLIGPRRYLQGRGVMASLGQHVADLGRDALVLADETVWGLVRETVTTSFQKAQVRLVEEVFGGECSHREIDRVTRVAESAEVAAVVGIGGGKTLDTAKAVGHQAGISWVTAPTVASTDAPTSALSVVYTDEGVFQEYVFFPRNPDLVLVDTQLAAGAPYRFLVSGMGDALATWVEARASSQAYRQTMAGGTPTMAGLALAKLCWEMLFDYGVAARDAAREHVVTTALEKTVEANTLLSGLGFESGGLAAAHAVHNGLTALHQTHHLMHGEKVNFGTLTQLIMEERPTEECDAFISLCLSVGLPTTFADLGVDKPSRDDLETVAKAATVPQETIHNMPFTVTADMVVDAMVAADAHARTYREETGRSPASVE